MQRFPTKPHHLFDEGGRIDRLDVLEGPSGRRTWSDDQKARIVMESYAPGAKVCDVARRHGMAPQHLSTWRGLAKKGKLVLPIAPSTFCDHMAKRAHPDLPSDRAKRDEALRPEIKRVREQNHEV